MTDKKVDDGDVRLEFIASYVMKTHRIKLDKWQKMMTSDDKVTGFLTAESSALHIYIFFYKM